MKLRRLSAFPINFYLSVIFIIGFSGFSFAGSVTIGYIVDPSNNPIGYATVLNQSNGLWLIGNSDGHIIFTERFHPGDTLEIQRIGYLPVTIVFPEKSGAFRILLTPAPIRFRGVEITAGQTTPQIAPFVEISVTPELGIVESAQTLSAIPGTYIKSYGGPAGISSLSLDGAPSSHTNIYFAGFDLTSAQNGQIDISQLPSSLIRNISYTPNLDLKNPERGNAEGSIEIEPDWSKTGIVASCGSYGHRSIAGNLNFHTDRFSNFLTIGSRTYDGNYTVKNPVNDEYSERRNNYFKQQFIAATSKAILSTRFFLDILTLNSIQQRGVAGLVWSPTPDAERRDRLSMFGSKLGWMNPFGFGYFQFLIKNTADHYINPQHNLDTRHSLFTYQALFKQRLTLSPSFSILLCFDSIYDRINSAATDFHDRISHKAMFSGNYSYSTRYYLRPSVALNYLPGRYAKANYDLQAGYMFAGEKGTIYLSAGKFSRFPSFNDLYWQPGGNPALKPEHTGKIIGGVDLNANFGLRLSTILYFKESKDLILWTPLQSYWQPKNIRQAIRKGCKIVLSWSGASMPLVLSTRYNYNISEDRTPGDYYKKPLRYAPKITSVLALTWKPRNFYFTVQLNHVSQRIAMYGWPTDQLLEPYSVCTVTASYTIRNAYGKFILTAAINNLGDEQYATLSGYPEPPRSCRWTLSYEVK